MTSRSSRPAGRGMLLVAAVLVAAAAGLHAASGAVPWLAGWIAAGPVAATLVGLSRAATVRRLLEDEVVPPRGVGGGAMALLVAGLVVSMAHAVRFAIEFS